MHSTVTVTNKSRATGTCHHVSFLAWYGQRGRGYLPLALPPRSRWSCAEGSKWKLCWKCSPSASWSLRAPAPRTAHRGGCAGGVLTLSLCTGQGTSIVPPAWCVRIFCFSETVKSKGRRAGVTSQDSTISLLNLLTPKGRSIVRRPCSVPVSVHRTTATITHTDHDKDTPHTPQTHARNQQQSARFLQARLARRHRKAVLSQRMHAALPTERASAAQPELILHQQHERTSAQPKASGGSRARREKKPITRRRTSSSSSSSCPLGCHWTAPAARPPPPGPPRHLPRW